MTNLKEENKKPSDYIKEEAENFANQQKRQVENTTSNIQDTTNKITNTINEYQNTYNYNLQKSIDTANKYQQQTINVIHSISDNYVDLQKNILITYQSVFSKFIDNTFNNNKSYWNKFIYPQKYTDVYNNANDNTTNNTVVNTTGRIHDYVLEYTENFNKSIELAQKYYNNSVQNFLSFVNNIQKSY
jgi:hypothetical protein